MIRSLLVYLFLGIGTALVLPWFILWTVIAGNADRMHTIVVTCVRAANRIAGVRVVAEGIGNVPPGSCILAANHASNVDPLVLFTAIPRRFSILVKRELFRLPILSTAMRLAHYVPVDRAGRQAVESIPAALHTLQQGVPLLIFAEGTRSPDGRLRPFKKGAFHTGIEAGVPIVPVSIAGSQRVMKKRDWRFHPGTVTIRFGSPVDASHYTMARRSELLARIQAAVASSLPRDQQPIESKSSSSPIKE